MCRRTCSERGTTAGATFTPDEIIECSNAKLRFKVNARGAGSSRRRERAQPERSPGRDNGAGVRGGSRAEVGPTRRTQPVNFDLHNIECRRLVAVAPEAGKLVACARRDAQILESRCITIAAVELSRESAVDFFVGIE